VIPKVYPDNAWEFFVGTGFFACSLAALIYLGYIVTKFKTKSSLRSLLIPSSIWLGVLTWEAFYDVKLLGPRSWAAQLQDEIAAREFTEGIIFISVNLAIFSIGPIVKFIKRYDEQPL
jgi:hypothetical protein